MVKAGFLDDYKNYTVRSSDDAVAYEDPIDSPILEYCENCKAEVELPCVKCRLDVFNSNATVRKTEYKEHPYSQPITALKPSERALEKLYLVGIKQVGHFLEETVDSLLDYVDLEHYELRCLLMMLRKLGINPKVPLAKLEERKEQSIADRLKRQEQLRKQKEKQQLEASG